jgi:molybdopterin-guanine dinucleotide biosynthesis protein A
LKSSAPARELDAAGFVLAGGLSSRMGTDKALVEFEGQPLIGRAIDMLRATGLPASIAGARSSLEAFAPVVPDLQSGLGPLGGICAALRSTPARHALFLAVDQPRVPSSLIAYLLQYAQITGSAVSLVTVNAFPETFPVVLDRQSLPALDQELATGRLGCYAAFQHAAEAVGQSIAQLRVEMLVQTGQVFHPDAFPADRWFLNVNTPADIVRAGSGAPSPVT